MRIRRAGSRARLPQGPRKKPWWDVGPEEDPSLQLGNHDTSQETCMYMKKVLLASSALALLGGAQRAQEGTYFSALAGANWFEELSAFSTTDIGSQETS